MKGKKGRPRKYRHDIRCPECGSNWCKKNGHQNGRQRFRYNECGRTFVLEAIRKKHLKKKRKLAFKMLAEGMSISAVAGTLDIPKGTISCCLYKEGIKLKKINDDKLHELKKEKGLEGVENISFDEIWTYVKVRRGKKRNSKRIWTAVIGYDESRLITYEVGNRDEKKLF